MSTSERIEQPWAHHSVPCQVSEQAIQLFLVRLENLGQEYRRWWDNIDKEGL